MATKDFLFSRMPTYDNSYEARTRRLKGAVIAQYKRNNPTKPIQGPRQVDASTLTTAKGGQGAYIAVGGNGQKTEYTGCCS
jgi:hypothetical protein